LRVSGATPGSACRCQASGFELIFSPWSPCSAVAPCDRANSSAVPATSLCPPCDENCASATLLMSRQGEGIPGSARFHLPSSSCGTRSARNIPRFAVQRSVLEKKGVTEEKISDIPNHTVLCSESPLAGLQGSMRKRMIYRWIATRWLSRSNRKEASQPQLPIVQGRRRGISPRRRPGARPWRRSRKTCLRGSNPSVWWRRSIVCRTNFAGGHQRSIPAGPAPGWSKQTPLISVSVQP
jgi:hypothetical protein